MAPRSRRNTPNTPAYGDFGADGHYGQEELFPGERVGPPLGRSGRKTMLRGAILLVVLGGGWALLGDQETRSRWLPSVTAAISSVLDRKLPQPTQETALATPPSPPATAVPTSKPPPIEAPPPSAPQPPAPSGPGAAANSPAPPVATAAPLPAATGSEESPASPLPPPIADPADPYQMRAAAVGLHPGLSRVLLARLSPTDYRNAGIAIRTALAETADDAVYIWPRQRKPDLALFHVRFVPGAAPDCRRYVVTVTKDGWLTTALPMERCGLQARGPSHK